LAWKQGVGRYNGSDRSTYFVTDQDGQLITVFAVGDKVGSGVVQRDISRRGDTLIVEKRYGGDETLPEIVLRPDMEGWWELSGAAVFSAEKPQIIVARSRMEQPRRSWPETDEGPSEMMTGVATMPSAIASTEQPELPQSALDTIAKLHARYRVRSGPAGLVLLFNNDGRVIVPDEQPNLFGNYLGSRFRHQFLRVLRKGEGVEPLQEVPFKKFADQGYVRLAGPEANNPGWYWEEGPESRYLCRRNDALRFNVATRRPHGWELGINNSRTAPQAVLGALTSENHVFPRARNGSSVELLVECLRGASRDITLLVATERVGSAVQTNLAVVRYIVSHEVDGGVLFDIANRGYNRPKYVVVYDKTGKPRIFLR